MSSEKDETKGPDLREGVSVRELEQKGMIGGHVDGKPALIAKVGDEVFAIGSKCTHYGGPLQEGLVVGETVRCPWHHACFSLRTGEPLRAPALSNVPCFEVEARGEKLIVLGKRAAEPSTKAKEGAPESVIIVGAGAAGSAAAQMLRRRGYEGAITMIGADTDAPYDRPNASKDYLAGTAPEEWMPLFSPAFYEEHRIELLVDHRVAKIEPQKRELSLSDGSTRSYGALLLATGAVPRTLPIPGADLPMVHTLRSLADSRAIIRASEGAKRAVVIGASFIGLEVAASLRTRGLSVDVVAREAIAFEPILGKEVGASIRALHESHGVRFHLGDSPKAFEEGAVLLEGGARLDADLVVTGVGVSPETSLAEATGLTVDRGVVVDEYMRTSAEGIFAAGDIARFPDRRSGEAIRVEHWVVAQRQGQTAAKNILGEKEAFTAAPFFWSQHYDVPILYVGHAKGWDTVDIDGDVAAHDCAVALRKGGKTLAVVTIGRDRVCLEAELAMERDDEEALAKLIPKGRS